jgi:hypothetical protein
MSLFSNAPTDQPDFLDRLARPLSEDVDLAKGPLAPHVAALLSDPESLVKACDHDTERLGWAVWRFCESSSSDCLRVLADNALPLAERQDLVRALSSAFDTWFRPFCADAVLARIDQPSHLDYTSARFWDLAPLGPQTAADAGIADQCHAVMTEQLNHPHTRIKECGLLGIEIWMDTLPDFMRRTVSDFSVKSDQPELSKRLELMQKHIAQ